MCYSAFFVLERCLTSDDNVFLESVDQAEMPSIGDCQN
jgi:hypothetical protein